jgi:hypothetical protein
MEGAFAPLAVEARPTVGEPEPDQKPNSQRNPQLQLDPEPELDIEIQSGASPLRQSQWMRLDTPAARWHCVLSWVVATALFAGIIALTGGPGPVDAHESVFSTWAIEHGQLTCAFPQHTEPHQPLVAPMYPIVSGAVAALGDIGASVPFPTRTAMGADCQHADAAIRAWATRSGATQPTLWIALVAWLFLMAGAVAFLRASGRGRRWWEPATVLALACLPPVWISVSFYFHPQDLMALGFSLAALACALRRRWAAIGVLVALAVLSQQFALLVAAPLLVLAPDAVRRLRFVVGGIATAVLVVAPLLVASSGAAWRAIALGSGDNASKGGTVIWEIDHHHALIVVGVSRILPIVAALAISWWVSRRLGAAACTPVVLTSLVALTLGLRLVFEQNVFAYYFMALAVLLVLLDVARGHIRGSLLAWLVAVTLIFHVPNYVFGTALTMHPATVLPPFIVLVAVTMVAFGVLRNSTHSDAAPAIRVAAWSLFLWSAVAVCALVTWRSGVNPLFHPIPAWLRQVAVVGTGIMLAAGPLLDELRRVRPRATEHATTTPTAAPAAPAAPAPIAPAPA